MIPQIKALIINKIINNTNPLPLKIKRYKKQ